MTEKAVFPIWSPIYQFTALKEGETEPEHAVVFEQGFIGKLSYDPEELPPDFDPRNLGVYYFDTMFGKWFLVPASGVDVENNCVVFATNHFTEFSLQPTLIKDLSPQEYKDMGRSPLKSYVEHGQLMVSPQGGTASVKVTELVLPGRDGFDFVLERHYDTATARMDAFSLDLNVSIPLSLNNIADGAGIWELIETYKETDGKLAGGLEFARDVIEDYLLNQGDYAYSMGQGWRLNIPYIRSGSSSLYLRLADGSMFSLYEMEIADAEYRDMTRKLTFQQHEGADFTLIAHQILQPFSYGVKKTEEEKDPPQYTKLIRASWLGVGYELILKDGTRYLLDGFGRTTKIIDASGKNEIQLNYKAFSLDSITDSLGRVIKFDYNRMVLWPRITRISLENDPLQREISYDVDYLLSNLKSSLDIGGRKSTYKCADRVLIGGRAGAEINFAALLLNAISGPFAGVAEQLFGSALTLFGSFQAEWVRPLVEIEAPGQGRISVGYDQKTFTYGTSDLQKFLEIPVSMTLTLNLEQRLYTTQVGIMELESKQTKNTSYAYKLGNSIMNQPYVFKCYVNEDLRRTTYNFTPIIKTRYRFSDKTLNIDLGGGVGFVPDSISTTYLRDDVLGYNSKIEIFDKQSNRVILQTLFEEINSKTFRPGREMNLRGTQKHVREFAYDNWGNCIREYDSGGNFEDPNDDLEILTRFCNAEAPELSISGLQGSPFSGFAINSKIHDRPHTRVVLAKTPVGAAGAPEAYLTETYYQYNHDGQLLEDATWDEEKWLRNKYAYHPEHGSIISHKRADDSEVCYDYDEHGLLVKTSYKQVTDVDGNSQDLVLEVGHEFATGLKLWEKDGRGYVTEYRYDKLGRQIAVVYPDEDDDLAWDPREGSSSSRANNPQETVHFDDEANSSTVIDALGNKSLSDYDSLGRLVQIIKYKQAGGDYLPLAITKLAYDAAGNVVRIEDPNGNATRYVYDGIGNLTATIYPDGTPNETDNPRETRFWDYNANSVTIKDPRGKEKTQYLDALGRAIREVQYGIFSGFTGPLVIGKQYDARGNLVQETDPRGQLKTSLYNHLNQLVEVRLPEDSFWENRQTHLARPIIRYGYDAVGNKVKEAQQLPDNSWQETSYSYDQLGRLIKTQVPYTDHLGNPQVAMTKTYYDAANHKIKELDPNNAHLEQSEAKGTSYAYSPRGYLLSVTDPAGNTISYAYDAVGNKIKLTDPRGNATPTPDDYTMWYLYDDLYRVVKGILPDDTPQDLSDNPTITLEYDPRGNNTKRIDPTGLETVWTYSSRNWVESMTTAGYTVSYSYDLVGNKLTETNSHQKTTHYSYDDLNRLSSMRLPEGNEELYLYDEVGNKTRVLDGRGNPTNYTYSAANKLLEVTDAKGQVTRYGYDRLGNQTRTVNALGQETINTYDELGRLRSTQDALSYSGYGYDAVGNLILSLDSRGTVSHYRYSANNLLLKVEQQNQEQRQYLEYSYDEAGQRLWATDGKVSLSWAYDPLGNVLAETRNLGTGESYKMEYRYDKANRLTKVRYPGDSSWLEYNYNVKGELVSIPGYINLAPVYDEGGYLASLYYSQWDHHSPQSRWQW